MDPRKSVKPFERVALCKHRQFNQQGLTLHKKDNNIIIKRASKAWELVVEAHEEDNA